MLAIVPWIFTAPPTSPSNAAPTLFAPMTEVDPRKVTLPVTALAITPWLLSPVMAVVPLVDRLPLSVPSSRMPDDWLPSIVIVPLWVTDPVWAAPD